MANIFKQFIPTIISILLISVSTVPLNRGVTFLGANAIKEQIQNELFEINIKNTAKRVNFGELINHDSPLGEKAITLNGISLQKMWLNFERPVVMCRDGEFSIESGKTSGALFYKGNVKLVIKRGDVKPAEEIESSLNVEVISGNVNIVRVYSYDEEKKQLTVRADFKAEFSIREIIPEDGRLVEHSPFIRESLDKLFAENKVDLNLKEEIQKDFKEYYAKKGAMDATATIQLNWDDNPKYELDMNFVSKGEAIDHDGQCGLAFSTSAYFKNLEGQKETQIYFPDFEPKSHSSLYLDDAVFDDMLRDAAKDFKIHGIVRNVKDLPFAMSMTYLNKFLPEISKSFSLTDQVEVHWAIFEPNLTAFDSQQLLGVAKLDATIWKSTRPMKQLMSFDAEIKFALSFTTDEDGVNLSLSTLWVAPRDINVRDSWGDLRFDIFSDWLEKFILQVKDRNIPLFKNPVDFGAKYWKVKVKKAGVLFQ
jgi:hypothetical protein